MKIDIRILFERADGHIMPFAPHEPVKGVYSDGHQSVTVDELANGATLTGAETLEQLDAAVADGRATFTRSETDDDYIARMTAKILNEVPIVAGCRVAGIISGAEHRNMDRYFRNAWKFAGGIIDVDMVKAVEIHKQKLRDIRAPKLAALDVAYMRADEAKDDAEKARITAEKDALRDATDDPIIGKATTPDELKAAIPAALE